MFPLLLCIAFVSSLAQTIPGCPGGTIQFNPPVDTEQYTWFPYNFTGAQPPLFPSAYNCKFNINVPQGWSANLVMTVNTTALGSDGIVSVIVVDSMKNAEAVSSTDQEAFFFVANGGSIVLDTRRSNTSFGFAVKWWKYYKFMPFIGNVTVASTQPAVYWSYLTDPVQMKAETKVSLVVTPPADDNLRQYLRSVLIFDGPDWNSTCLGTALQVVGSKKQLVSSGQYMTVALLRPFWSTGNSMLIFQDYENTKDIVEYQGVTCAFTSFCGQFRMDASKGPAAISTVNSGVVTGAEYLTGLTGTGTLDVYIGGKSPSKANLIASYPVADSSRYLPQEFLGYVRTYLLNGSGGATMNTTASSPYFTQNAVVGRKGFIASRFYKSGSVSPFQDVYDYISTSTGTLSHNTVNFSFNIREADFVGNTTLTITVRSKGKDVYNQVFSSSNKPSMNTQIQALGEDFSVDYKTYHYQTSGFYLDFELLKSSSKTGLLMAFVIIFMYFL